VKLPFLLSVPHAGWRIPPEAESYCVLSAKQVEEDGDLGAREIYDLESEVVAYLTTDIARAIVDLNRAEDDRRSDGVIKTHTCWGIPVYREPLPEDVIRALLDRYYHPYHRRLRELATAGVKLAVDCHTMAAVGPPVAPDPGRERPWVCLSNADGTCPEDWVESLGALFQNALGPNVRINQPFKGGFITRSHSKEMPWVQLELSRAAFKTSSEKRAAVLEALRGWCASYC
jgi:formiminoglutamase